jgi:hypothetical protein
MCGESSRRRLIAGVGRVGRARLLDHAVSPQQHRLRDGEAERLRRLEVDDQFELRGLLDGKVAGLGAFENLVDVGRRPTRSRLT